MGNDKKPELVILNSVFFIKGDPHGDCICASDCLETGLFEIRSLLKVVRVPVILSLNLRIYYQALDGPREVLAS